MAPLTTADRNGEAGWQGPLDVLVWGGGTGGVAAALQAARRGARTLLLTPGGWIGGMVSAAGVCCPDGNELTPWQTGLWGALLRQLAVEEPAGLDHNWVSCFGYQPGRAEAILRRWLAAEPLLGWWPGCCLETVERQGDRLAAVVIDRGRGPERLLPRIVIDGSDRGELLAVAEAPHRLGWEPRELWGEPSAPPRQRLDTDPFFQRQPVQSPTWVAMGRLDPDRPPATTAREALPLAHPFEGATEAFGLERTLTYGRLPGGLVMLNWPLAGNDWHEGLQRAFSSPADRLDADLADAMAKHSLSFLSTLTEASGGRLQPAAVFPDGPNALAGALAGPQALALMPYWREGRRLVGLVTVVEHHLLPTAPGAALAPLPLDGEGRTTAIAVGNYANDHHYPGGDWPLAAKSCRWGGRWSGTPFTIPYGALVSAGVRNLLAADKCLSVSHMANGATRLQPLVLAIGQAAGMAAALCVAAGVDPAELPPRRLQEALVDDPLAPAAVVPLWDTPWHHPHWRQRQRQVLEDPGELDGWGHLAGAQLDPYQAPPEPGERRWHGLLHPDGDGGFRLECEGRSWPVITLEPALHHWLSQLERPRRQELIGCANPWGPWLRLSRLAR